MKTVKRISQPFKMFQGVTSEANDQFMGASHVRQSATQSRRNTSAQLVTTTQGHSAAIRFLQLGLLVLSLTFASLASTEALGWESDLDEMEEIEEIDLAAMRESVKQCGTVSYDTQGGSLVINKYEVQVPNPSLEASLIREARRSPFNACLIGAWLHLPRGKVFQADSREQ